MCVTCVTNNFETSVPWSALWDSSYRVICPKCFAAVGALCTEPVRDGCKFVSYVHEERKERGDRLAVVDPDIAGDESD